MSEYIDSKTPMRPQDIRWETVKTEEEEYLDKLQSKLTRVMDGFQPTPPNGMDDSADLNEVSDMARVSRPISQVRDHDEGLHLMYDCPRPALDGASSTQPFPSSSQPQKTDVSTDADILPSSRQRSIRFRSRVRITSGVHSVSSSCGSRSSSISVPLQGPHGPNVSKSRATLSDIAPFEDANSSSSSLASPLRASSTPTRHQPRRNSASSRSSPVDERTPLASASRSGSRRSYTERFEDEEEEEGAELDRLRAAARKSEEEVIFGKWPRRLLNLHWWWWKIEPIVCCSWLDDDSDLE